MRSPPPEEEGAAETTCDELTAIPISHPSVLLRGRRQRKLGVKLSPGIGERWGKGVIRFRFYFSLSYSDLTGDKFN